MNKIRILIVDDSSVMRKMVERSLRHAGLDLDQVLEAGNGTEALGVLAENAVDMVLCDINMPVMNGIEFLLKAREKTPDSVRFMLTGNADQQTAMEAVNKGHVFQFNAENVQGSASTMFIQLSKDGQVMLPRITGTQGGAKWSN